MTQPAKRKVETLLLVVFILLLSLDLAIRFSDYGKENKEDTEVNAESEKKSSFEDSDSQSETTEETLNRENNAKEPPNEYSSSVEEEENNEQYNKNEKNQETEENRQVNSNKPRNKKKEFVNKYGFTQYSSSDTPKRVGPPLINVFYCTS